MRLLRRPNRYQTRVEFFRCWVISILLHGNTYVLLERDASRRVVAMYVLDPALVMPLVTEDGGGFSASWSGSEDKFGIAGFVIGSAMMRMGFARIPDPE